MNARDLLGRARTRAAAAGTYTSTFTWAITSAP